MGGTCEMKSPFHMQDGRTSLRDEHSPSVRKLYTDNPSIVTGEQTKSELFFNLSDLSAERRLGKVQSEGSLGKV
jgi:hypothetical protein